MKLLPIGPTAVIQDRCSGRTFAFGVGMTGKGPSPRDVIMVGRVQGVAAFIEDPAGAGMDFAQGEVIGGDVLVASG